MIGRQFRSRLSMLITSIFVFGCASGVVLAQEKSGSDVLKPLVTENVDEQAAAADKAMDKAVEKVDQKADEAVKAIEKKAEKPLVGVGAAAPGSHEGFIPTVSTQYGSITVLGVFQTLLDTRYQLTVNSDTKNKDDRFDKITATLQRARIIFKGHVITENLTYFFQGDARNAMSFALDMTLGYKFWDTGLSVRVGRFVPEFSYMMPRNTADLAAINYPLYQYVGLAGNFDVWRQIGLDITYQPIAELKLIVGVFNGMIADPYKAEASKFYMQMGDILMGNTETAVSTPDGKGAKMLTANNVSNISDNNRAKDVMLRVAYKPMKTLSIDFNAWLGFPANYGADGKLLRYTSGPDKNSLVPNDTLIMGGPGVEYNDGTLHVVGEFMWRYLKHREGGVADQKAIGAWAHAGYRFTKLIEGILRFDWVKFDLDANESWNRKSSADYANMLLMRVTAGPHFWLEEKHFRILVNLFCDIPLEQMEKRQTNLGLQAQFAALW